MRQPTFFAHACPRFDHHVYCSGRGSTRRNTSTNPSSSNTCVSHARSSGRKPEFFWLLRQFFRSIGWCAMFQSPQRMISRFDLRSRGEVRQELREEAELRRLPVRPARPRRQVQADHGQVAEIRAQVAALAVELAAAEPGRELRRRARVDTDARVALLLGRMERRQCTCAAPAATSARRPRAPSTPAGTRRPTARRARASARSPCAPRRGYR